MLDEGCGDSVKEKPILFSGPLVRAILEGRKTQTRRIAKGVVDSDESGWDCMVSKRRPTGETVNHHFKRSGGGLLWPYKIGQRLWVRETWADADRMYQGHTNDTPGTIAYFADKSAIQFNSPSPRKVPKYDLEQWNWDSLEKRPSIFLPRWASRITLEVTSVRIERLGDITEADALAEGITGPVDVGYPAYRAPGDSKPRFSSAVAAFENLWDSVNDEREGCSFADAPWVWVIGFRLLESGEVAA